MYDYLSEAVVKALEMFCIEKEHSIENAIELLKNVHSKTQEIILLVNPKSWRIKDIIVCWNGLIYNPLVIISKKKVI